MGALPLGNSIAPCFITSSQENPLIFSPLSKSNGVYAPILVRVAGKSSKWHKISSKLSGSEVGKGVSGKNKMEEYNVAMKRMMRNPYEYHHDLEFVVLSAKLFGEAKDFDPDSLRSGLPKSVSLLEWAISEEKGRVYVHCTAGLGRAPAVAIAYMFWFCDMDLTTAYETLTSKRPCGPNKRAIRGATYDLAKNDPWKEPFENLPDNAFEGIADWERALIQDRVRALRHS
nr:phosphoglucan phosphatase LSF2, chloroplastic [Ipomoea batatas]